MQSSSYESVQMQPGGLAGIGGVLRGPIYSARSEPLLLKQMGHLTVWLQEALEDMKACVRIGPPSASFILSAPPLFGGS